MWTYLLICSWFIVGIISFFALDYMFKPKRKTRKEFIEMLIIISCFGYLSGIGTIITFVNIYLNESEWWNENI